MPSIILDSSQWPFCFVQIDGEPTTDDYERYIGEFNRLYERKQPFSVLTFIKRYGTNREIIARTGRWFKETEPLMKQYWVSNAMVAESAGFRFVLSAVFLIKPLSIPSDVCATPEKALAFTRARWQERGLTPPLQPRWPF
jgi:hypothetical protein